MLQVSGTFKILVSALLSICHSNCAFALHADKMFGYDVQKLYEDTYKLDFNWKKWLPPRVHDYHQLLYEEFNSPIELQMGVLLPFISSCCGPNTRGSFLTRPSVLNLFWLNVAASGVGKTQTRKHMISRPLQYIMDNSKEDIQDFEVSRYTRAGMLSRRILIACN